MHNLGFVLFLSNTAKPAKRQPTAQPVPVAMAQPVVAPVAQNGKEIIKIKKILNNSIFSAFCFGEGINYSFTLRCSAVNCVRKIFKNEDLVLWRGSRPSKK